MGFSITDHTAEILGKKDKAVNKALTAMALVAIEAIQGQMDTGYGAPIWDTGDLHRSITKGEPDGESIEVGTNMEYAPFVHDGTYKMIARPFIKDALNDPLVHQAMQEVGQEALNNEF